MILTPDKIMKEPLGVVINQKIIPMGAIKKNSAEGILKGMLFKADKLMQPQWITIHNTDDIKEAPGTNDAEQYARACYPNDNLGTARVHFWVDDEAIWQQLREDEMGWHAGDGAGPGNGTSIAMEIIMGNSNTPVQDAKAEDNGARLAAILLHRWNLPIERLTTHNHWMGLPDRIVPGAWKNCPWYILPHWPQFIAKVKVYLDQLKKPESELSNKAYRIQLGYFESAKGAYEYSKKCIEALITGGVIKAGDTKSYPWVREIEKGQ